MENDELQTGNQFLAQTNDRISRNLRKTTCCIQNPAIQKYSAAPAAPSALAAPAAPAAAAAPAGAATVLPAVPAAPADPDT